MEDWKKHLKVHLDEWIEFQHFSAEDIVKVKQVVSMLLQEKMPERLNDFEDIDDLKRMLELCEATDEERSGKNFAGNEIQRDTVVHLPLTRNDISIIHFAIDDAIENKVVAIVGDYFSRKKRR